MNSDRALRRNLLQLNLVIALTSILISCDKAPDCGEGTKLVDGKCVAEASGETPKIETDDPKKADNSTEKTGVESSSEGDPECPYLTLKVPDKASFEDIQKFSCSLSSKKDADVLKTIASINPALKMKMVLADIPMYYGKETTFIGKIEISDYYNYKFGDEAKATHYSFDFTMFEGLEKGRYGDEYKFEITKSVNLYGEREKFKEFYNLVAILPEKAEKPPLFKVVAKTTKDHGNEGIWTLISAEPYMDWTWGKCCMEAN